MNFCQCTLGNTRACEGCPNNPDNRGFSPYPYSPYPNEVIPAHNPVWQPPERVDLTPIKLKLDKKLKKKYKKMFKKLKKKGLFDEKTS